MTENWPSAADFTPKYTVMTVGRFCCPEATAPKNGQMIHGDSESDTGEPLDSNELECEAPKPTLQQQSAKPAAPKLNAADQQYQIKKHVDLIERPKKLNGRMGCVDRTQCRAGPSRPLEGIKVKLRGPLGASTFSRTEDYVKQKHCYRSC